MISLNAGLYIWPAPSFYGEKKLHRFSAVSWNSNISQEICSHPAQTVSFVTTGLDFFKNSLIIIHRAWSFHPSFSITTHHPEV